MEKKFDKQLLKYKLVGKHYKLQQLIGINYWLDLKHNTIEDLNTMLHLASTCYETGDGYYYFSVEKMFNIYPLFRLKIID